MSTAQVSSFSGFSFSGILILKPTISVKSEEYDRNLLHSISDLSIIQKLIDKGIQVNNVDIRGNTPLHIAVDWYQVFEFEPKHLSGELEKVKLLIQNGANVKAVNNHKQKPLDFAKTKEIREYLLGLE